MNKLFFFLAVIFSFAVAGGMILLSTLFGPKKRSQIKDENFECGMSQAMPVKRYINTNFYLVAVIFLIFDIELILIYPWVWGFDKLGKDGFWGGVVFLVMILVLTLYLIRRKAVEWD